MRPFKAMLLGSVATPDTATTFSSNMMSTSQSLDGTKRVVTNDGTDLGVIRSPDFKTSGKYYFEVVVTTQGVGNSWRIGVANWKFYNSTGAGGGTAFGKYATIGNNSGAPTSQLFSDSATTNFGSTWVNGDIIQVKVDLDGGNVYFAQNGGSYSSAVALTSFGPTGIIVQTPGSNTAAFTLKATSASWTYSAPVGYGEWSKNSTYTGRYWRWQTLQAGGTADGQTIAEMSMKTSLGGSNVLSGGTASASSTFSTLVAANALDGNASTMWASNGEAGTAWWQYDLGSGNTAAIKEYTYSIRNDGYIQYARGFCLLYSSDATNWYLAEQTNNKTWTSGASKTFQTVFN